MLSPSAIPEFPTPTLLPQWIARMYASKEGRDHLGLGSVSSDQILPSLSPSINVLTPHPRYHSFYVFLLDEFWRRERPRTSRAWVTFFRPREFIFSLGANLCPRPEHGALSNVVGSAVTQPLAREEQSAYTTTTNYIKSPQGGYGLYYRSVMIELGWVFPGGPGYPYRVDVPSESGKELAVAFREAVQDTVYYKRYFGKDEARVPLDVIREFIARACLCQLKTSTAPDRPLLLKGFLQAGSAAPARRATFRLLLDLGAQTQKWPIDQMAFRQLIYFGQADNGATYTPARALVEVHKRWRLYQAREYYAFALNALWAYLCEWGLQQQGDVRPIPLETIWTEFDAALDNFKTFATSFKLKPPHLTSQSSFQELLTWLTQLAEGAPCAFDRFAGLEAPLNEHRLYELTAKFRAVRDLMVCGMVSLLGLIYLRFNDPALVTQPEWAVARMGENGRLSLSGFIAQLRRRLQSGAVTLSEVTRWLVNDYLILQHLVVATTKLPENTFRFQREGNQLRFYNLTNRLEFLDSRFNALSATLCDFGLCEAFDDAPHILSAEGRQLLETGDL